VNPLVVSINLIVLTVSNIENSLAFYMRTLGMEAREFKPGRFALHFGEQKINLHEIGNVVDTNMRHARISRHLLSNNHTTGYGYPAPRSGRYNDYPRPSSSDWGKSCT